MTTQPIPFLLTHLLEHAAARDPARLAVRSAAGELTYAELDRASTALARALRERGVQPGDRVGTFQEKSLQAVVTLFGILKAGAAYVPIDPGSPAKRAAYMVENCHMSALVTTADRLAKLDDQMAGLAHLRVVVARGRVASDRIRGGPEIVAWDAATEGDARPLEVGVIEQDLAYILYTSGSTGQPKGVMITHRASLAFVRWAMETFELGPEDVVSSHAPFHFDLSILDVFASIGAGATVNLVPDALSIFPAELAKWMEDKEITVWYSVPSVLTRMLLHGDLTARAFPRLRVLLFAGEVFPTKYLVRWMRHVPGVRFANLYGPTETNVCTYYEVHDVPADEDEPIPIGAACANTETFVVKEDGSLAGVGQEGELYVRGPTVFSGYWGMEEGSRAVLVPDPRTEPWRADTVHRTGDIVVPMEGGDLRFIGRRDHMVKSRGYRIELGEIEAALYTNDAVEEAVVVAIPDDEVGNLIKAVVVVRDGHQLTHGQLERACAKRLPKYMVPQMVEFRDGLPKTSTGKVDRPALVDEHLALLDAAAGGRST